MPLYLDLPSSPGGSNLRQRSACGTDNLKTSNPPRPSLTIGLVNNMQNGALEATERQFVSLLEAASQNLVIRLRLYTLPGISQGTAETRLAKRYSEIESMWDEGVDGLIVTGREPATARLQDEPYWDSFVRLLDWAQNHTLSTIWSCLAAHAAVLQLDGIPRVRNPHKQSGLFDCELVSDHLIAEGMPSRFRMPHSRWNGLDEGQLVEHGYEILTKSKTVGVDAFVRQKGNLFLFFQGHPEYEVNTLLLEYRRDAARYLRGEAAVYPAIPHGYFDDQTTAALRDIAHEARLFPREELLREVAAILGRAQVQNSWYATAVSIYSSWLQYLAVAERLPFHRSTGTSASTKLPAPKHVVGTKELGSRHASIAVRSIQ
jgi:homoserine O-succinyltransferase